jgi:DNA-binding MarR family transcriptional regulator
MTDPTLARIEEIVRTHWAIMQALQMSTRPEWMELDLTMAQIKTLFVLFHTPAAPIRTVADYLGIGRPTASHLVEKLVRAGLVQRSEGVPDRRFTLAGLTAQGEDLVVRLYQGGEEQYRVWVSQLGEADRAALLQGLRALSQIAQAPSPSRSQTVEP